MVWSYTGTEAMVQCSATTTVMVKQCKHTSFGGTLSTTTALDNGMYFYDAAAVLLNSSLPTLSAELHPAKPGCHNHKGRGGLAPAWLLKLHEVSQHLEPKGHVRGGGTHVVGGGDGAEGRPLEPGGELADRGRGQAVRAAQARSARRRQQPRNLHAQHTASPQPP